MNYRFLCVVTFLSIIIAAPSSFAQNSAVETDKGALIELGTGYSIESDILERAWPYEVYLPTGYNDSTYAPRSYPVLVVLSRNFQLAVSLTQTMSQNDQIPPMLIVGVPMGGARTYHGYLTPSRNLKLFNGRELPGVFGMSGQAENFHSFLKSELLPRIDAEYRTMPYRVLAGESIAGLFTLYTVLNDPDTFQGYLAIEPSLWWDEEVLVQQLDSAIQKDIPLHGEVYMALASRPVVGDSRTMMDQPIRKFARLLETKESPDLHLKLEEFPEEHHLTAAPLAFYHGLQHIFDGYEAPPGQFDDQPQTIVPHFKALSERLGVEFKPPESLVDGVGSWALQDALAGPSPDQEKIKTAIKLLETNVNLYPTSSHAHKSLARAYKANGDTASAIHHLEQALELNPKDTDVKEQLDNLGANK